MPDRRAVGGISRGGWTDGPQRITFTLRLTESLETARQVFSNHSSCGPLRRRSHRAAACGCTSLGSTRWWCRATGPPRCARCPSGTRAITRCGLARGGL